MNLSPGGRIGVYEVLEPLGAGGMGEVYRARDTRLGRDVALKVLPQTVAADPERRARLEREARLLASLNHPNIATLHGIEDSPAGCALVMELIDGETLADRLALRASGRTALPVKEALTIARQIADALESAHERGVVHRDLKPANIKIRQDGTVKVLDFGLATVLTSPSTGSLADTAVLTEPPGISGTAPYMSPEQARGEASSPQTDIWSFGVVLYELLTGVSPFARPTTAETLASVLGEEPDYTRLPLETPGAVGRLIRRCLQKDQRERLRHIGDARFELADAQDGSGSGPDSKSTVSRVSDVGHARLRWIAVAIGIGVLGGSVGWWLRPQVVAEPQGVFRFWIPVPESPSSVVPSARHLAISPDGTRIAYASRSGLWLRRIGQAVPTLVPMTSASSPFFSPDGEWVGFFGQTGGEVLLLKVPALGGNAETIVAAPDRPGGGTWRADGTIVFAAVGGLYQVPATGGDRQLLARPDAGRKERGYLWPEFLPDGRSVLFTVVRDGSIDSATIALLDLSTLETTSLIPGSDARYAPTGHLIFASGQTLKAVAFDADLRRTQGEPVAFQDLPVAAAITSGAAEFAVSTTGTLLFLATDATSEVPLLTMSWISRSGKEEPLGLAPDRYSYPRISPDETRIAVDIRSTRRNIWIWDLRRSWLTKVTDGPAEDMLPVWQQDSSRLFFSSRQVDGDFDLYSQAADGAPPARREFAGPGAQAAQSFTPDGRLLIAIDYKDIGLFTLGSAKVESLLHSGASEWAGAVSPDGNWIAYESNESGDPMQIFVRPFPAVAGRREQVSIEGGRWPVWGPKGSGELYYVDLKGQMMAAAIELSPTLRVLRVTKLFDWRAPMTGISGIPYDVSRRDGRFLITRSVTDSVDRPAPISVVQNWFEELTRAVPGS